jgi:uncharacterized protein with PQ loop repeat
VITAETLLGATGSIISVSLWLPQFRSTWRHRRDHHALAAMSVGTQTLLAVNAVVWVLYAALSGSWWVGVPSAVNLPLAVFTIVTLVRSRRSPMRSPAGNESSPRSMSPLP